MNLLSIQYEFPMKRLQESSQEITGLLSRDYGTPMNLLKSAMDLLSMDYTPPIKRLQDSYQEITELL